MWHSPICLRCSGDRKQCLLLSVKNNNKKSPPGDCCWYSLSVSGLDLDLTTTNTLRVVDRKQALAVMPWPHSEVADFCSSGLWITQCCLVIIAFNPSGLEIQQMIVPPVLLLFSVLPFMKRLPWSNVYGKLIKCSSASSLFCIGIKIMKLRNIFWHGCTSLGSIWNTSLLLSALQLTHH